MPFVGAGHKVYAVAHFCVEQDHLGLAVCRMGELEGLDDGLVVVPVGLDYAPAEGGPLVAQVANAAHFLNGAVYLLAVPVCERYKIVQLVLGRPHTGLPDLAFLALSVSKEAEHAFGIAVHLFAEGDAGGAGKALAEGARGLEDAGERVRHARMALQAGAELTQGAEFCRRKVACAGKHGVINRCQMPGGNDECVLTFGVAPPACRVLLHFVEIEGGHNVGDAERPARMPGLCGGNHTDDVPADLRGDFA